MPGDITLMPGSTLAHNTSANGFPSSRRRSPPVCQVRRQSANVIPEGMGFRKIPQGSWQPRGIEHTSGNSSSAFLGRSPPRKVRTKRIKVPRNSRPLRTKALNTNCERKVLLAINTCPPGRKACIACVPHSKKKALNRFPFFLLQCSKTRQRRTDMPIECRWYSPDAAIPGVFFCKLIEGVFLHAIGWVGDNAMQGIFRQTLSPLEAICMDDGRVRPGTIRIVQYE